VWEFTIWNQRLGTTPKLYALSSPTPSSSRLRAPLLAVFVIGVIVGSALGMGLLRLTTIHHRDIALVSMVTVLFVLAGAIGALSVLYHSTDTQREVLSAFALSLLCPLTLFPLLHLLLLLVDQRDEHVTEHTKDREISAVNAVTGFRHRLLQQKDLPTGLIDFSLLSPNHCVRET
jgi:hypothetical protein